MMQWMIFEYYTQTERKKKAAPAARRWLVEQTQEDDSEMEVTFSAMSPPSPSQVSTNRIHPMTD